MNISDDLKGLCQREATTEGETCKPGLGCVAGAINQHVKITTVIEFNCAIVMVCAHIVQKSDTVN